MTRSAVDLPAWVSAAGAERGALEFRQAVHTILHALESVPGTSTWLALKGAVLLSLRYGFSRTTTDIDFSTTRLAGEFDVDEFRAAFAAELSAATEILPHGLACRIQSHRVDPPGAGASYPTLRIRVGYAPKAEPRRLRKLMSVTGSPNVVTVDVSFNEPAPTIDVLDDGGRILIPAYALQDFLAEKLRAILQQTVRNRFRPQDALDVFILPKRTETRTAAFRVQVLRSLLTRCDARELPIDALSMRDAGIRQRSERDYASLAAQVEGELPPFAPTFDAVVAFYESLPWAQTSHK
jgi:hypothetical protein